MAPNSWKQKIDIKEDLFKKSSRFSYVQAIRLLAINFENKSEEIESKIRTHPRLSLDFPHSDIVGIKEENELIKLTVTFLGLYGESSPLPTFYTESLLEEELNDEFVVRNFIDIFNIPLYQKFFNVWLKNKLGVRINEFHDEKALKLLHTFSGMPNKELRKKHIGNYPLLKYAALNMQFPRSAEALRTLISDIVSCNDVEIIQCIEQMAPIPSSQYCFLGSANSSLGDNLHLGTKIKDRMNKFRVSITNLSMESFNLLLPNGKNYNSLSQAIKLYLVNTLTWDLQLTLKESEYIPITLGGDGHSRLGLNTWFDGKTKKPKTLFLNQNQHKVN
ncbi:MAG: type VI secretion system baseplate subunit TssG [Helicobacteraceae bacterium]|nr:type VI secretion system baseplate subunit TssG [Helicobacteraceae bacterium]